jgi:Periplasmic protease
LVLLIIVVALVAFIGISTQRRCDAQGGKDYEYIGLFTDVMTIVKKSYVEEVDSKKLIYGAINGMLAALDPHSSFMSPDTFKEMKVETKGAFGGLGIEISMKEGILTVISPIEDTPAQRAGIKAGDQILRIDERFTKDLTITDSVKRMRGPKGSKVVLTIMRDGFERPKEFTLVRDIIQVKSVKSRMLDNGYGYIRVAQFQERSDEDVAKALKASG